MSLKDEIKNLRGALKSDIDADDVREAAADIADEGASRAERVSRKVHEAADHLRDPHTYADLRDNFEATVCGVSSKIEKFPGKYPIVTALGALGIGLALGVALGRKNR